MAAIVHPTLKATVAENPYSKETKSICGTRLTATLRGGSVITAMESLLKPVLVLKSRRTKVMAAAQKAGPFIINSKLGKVI